MFGHHIFISITWSPNFAFGKTISQPHLHQYSLTVVLRRVLNVEQPNALLIWGALDYSHIFMRQNPWCTMLLSLVWRVYGQNLSESANGLHRPILRRWNWSGQVSVRYRGSEFLGRATAADLLTHFKNGIGQLDPKRLLQVSMHGVNCGSSTLIWHESAKHRNSPNCWTSAAEKSWKQFKLSWKSHGIVLSDFCGNPEGSRWLIQSPCQSGAIGRRQHAILDCGSIYPALLTKL